MIYLDDDVMAEIHDYFNDWPTDEPPLTAERVREACGDREWEHCSACDALFEPDDIDEDVCPDCGAEGFMCIGLSLEIDCVTYFVAYP